MKTLTRPPLNRLAVIILLLVGGCAAVTSSDDLSPRVSVTFMEPEKFTDARRAELEPTSKSVLGELQNFIVQTGARYVPENMRLTIKVTNVDLAGDFELFRGPQAGQVRIIKGLYPPRIVLDFELVDSAGSVIKAGKRNLTDINYQLRSVYPREDALRYEKDLLRDWLRSEFNGVQGRTVG